MDETTCARILWATTARLRTSSGHEEEVRKARGALAAILRAGASAGFPAPVEPSRAERDSPAWKECVAAARNPMAPIAPATVPPMFALLWAGDKAGGTPGPADGHGLSWPKAAGTMPETVMGPMEDGAGRELHLFLYRDIDAKAALEADGDSNPGLFPRGTSVAAPLAFAPAAAAAPGAAPAAPWSGGWSWILLAASIASTGLALVWVYGAAEFARGAVNEVALGTLIDREVAQGEVPAGKRRGLYPAAPPVEPVDAKATWVDENGRLRIGAQPAVGPVVAETADGNPTGKLTVEQDSAVPTQDCLTQLRSTRVRESVDRDRAACARLWRIAWANQVPSAARGDDWWASTLAGLWGPTNIDGQLSLLWPLVLAALSVVALILGAGVATRRYLLGAVIDERGRMSLSRLQQLAWTVVLFGGFTVLGVFNIALLAGFVRDLGQAEAARAIEGDAAASQMAALPEFWAFFPSLDPVLWAVLGITVVVSPYLSQRILASKPIEAQGSASADFARVEVRTPGEVGMLEARDSPAKAEWSDLFRGEETANKDQVDVSRLQHLVITGLLLGGYVVLLLEYVRTVDGPAVLLANLTGAPVFAAMPPVDGTFVGLLALSHAGYLAFKALPGKPTGGTT